MPTENSSFTEISASVQQDAPAVFAGLAAGIESGAAWLLNGTQATALQYSQLGDQLLSRAAELSQKISNLAEGVGTPSERLALVESAQRINSYIETTRAGGVAALEVAGATAASAARQALVGAAARVAGPAADGYQYVRDLYGAIEGGDWAKFGGTADLGHRRHSQRCLCAKRLPGPEHAGWG
jgi:hypothetical protein